MNRRELLSLPAAALAPAPGAFPVGSGLEEAIMERLRQYMQERIAAPVVTFADAEIDMGENVIRGVIVISYDSREGQL